jgi:hypothetical protein
MNHKNLVWIKFLLSFLVVTYELFDNYILNQDFLKCFYR